MKAKTPLNGEKGTDESMGNLFVLMILKLRVM